MNTSTRNVRIVIAAAALFSVLGAAPTLASSEVPVQSSAEAPVHGVARPVFTSPWTTAGAEGPQQFSSHAAVAIVSGSSTLSLASEAPLLPKS